MLATDLKIRTPAEDSAATSNGGRITGTAITSGVTGNTWPAVTPAERAAGATLYRKRFLHVADDDDGTLLDAKVWLDAPTPGEDYVVMFAGTDTDTQDDITGSEDCYGSAPVTTAITAGGSSIIVTVDDSAMLPAGATPIFRAGDIVRLTKQTTPSTTATTAEFLTIATGGVGTPSGNEITITVDETIANNYALVDSPRLCSVLELGDIETSFTAVSYTGGADYDTTTYPPILDNIGTFTQRLTFTFTDATTFTVAGDSMGALASGVVGSDYSPTNSAVSKPLLTLEAGGWSGLTITAGDTFVLDIFGAQKAIWRKRVVPAGASYFASNQTVLAVYGAAA